MNRRNFITQIKNFLDEVLAEVKKPCSNRTRWPPMKVRGAYTLKVRAAAAPNSPREPAHQTKHTRRLT